MRKTKARKGKAKPTTRATATRARRPSPKPKTSTPKRGALAKPIAALERPARYDEIAEHVICDHCNQPKSQHSARFGRCPSWATKRPGVFKAQEADTALGRATVIDRAMSTPDDTTVGEVARRIGKGIDEFDDEPETDGVDVGDALDDDDRINAGDDID